MKSVSDISREDQQILELPNTPDVLDLLAAFQKMKIDEQELLKIKQVLLTTQQELQSKLEEEVNKKKMAIDELKSEIPDLQNKCRQLGQILGIDILKLTH